MAEWQELVVEGARSALRAFVAGFLAGAHAGEGDVLFGEDVHLEPASLGERLRDLVHAGSHHVLLAPEPLAGSLAAALAHPDVPLRLERARVVAEAHFTFEAETFTRDGADEVRQRLLARFPAGVRVADVVEHEETHPEAHGVELYAPLHNYVYRVRGRSVGSLPGVLEMHRRAQEMEFVEPSYVHLEGK